MERNQDIGIAIIILVFILCLFFAIRFVPIYGINAHPDDGLYFVDEVRSQCDFDLSQTKYVIDTLNNGQLTLRYKDYDIRVQSGNSEYINGKDTCYLKLRAYYFWMNDLK